MRRRTYLAGMVAAVAAPLVVQPRLTLAAPANDILLRLRLVPGESRRRAYTWGSRLAGLDWVEERHIAQVVQLDVVQVDQGMYPAVCRITLSDRQASATRNGDAIEPDPAPEGLVLRMQTSGDYRVAELQGMDELPTTHGTFPWYPFPHPTLPYEDGRITRSAIHSPRLNDLVLTTAANIRGEGLHQVGLRTVASFAAPFGTETVNVWEGSTDQVTKFAGLVLADVDIATAWPVQQSGTCYVRLGQEMDPGYVFATYQTSLTLLDETLVDT